MMVKHFLIDGYNLAHKLSIKITKDNLQQVRDDVRRKVSTHKAHKKCKITLVFDGRGVLGATETHQHIVVIFTASGETADARIKKIIDGTPNKSTLCVVSSDNEILRYAQVSRTQTMRSEDFLVDFKPDIGSKSKQRVTADMKATHARTEHKPTEVSLSDIEAWKKLFQ